MAVAGGAVVMVPTCVALAGDGAHVCGSGKRWRWYPCVWQWLVVVVVPTCVAVAGGAVVVPTCVAVAGGAVVMPAYVAVADDGGGARVCGRRWCPPVWQWLGVVMPTCVAVEGSGGDAYVFGRGSGRQCGGGGARVCGSGRQLWWCPRVWQCQVMVPTCVAVASGGGGATCVAVASGGGGAHV